MEDAKNPDVTWQHHMDGPKMQTINFGIENIPQIFYFVGDLPTMP